MFLVNIIHTAIQFLQTSKKNLLVVQFMNKIFMSHSWPPLSLQHPQNMTNNNKGHKHRMHLQPWLRVTVRISLQSASQLYWAASLAGDTLFTWTLSSHIQSQPRGITKSHLVNKLIKTSIRRLTLIFFSSSRSWVQLTRWKKTTAYWCVWTLFRLKSRLSVWTEKIKASRTSRLRQHFENHFKNLRPSGFSQILENLGYLNAVMEKSFSEEKKMLQMFLNKTQKRDVWGHGLSKISPLL